MSWALAALAGAVLAGVAVWLWLRTSTAIGTDAAKTAISTAAEVAKNKAQAQAQAILQAPASDLDARVAQLRERGRSGK